MVSNMFKIVIQATQIMAAADGTEEYWTHRKFGLRLQHVATVEMEYKGILVCFSSIISSLI